MGLSRQTNMHFMFCGMLLVNDDVIQSVIKVGSCDDENATDESLPMLGGFLLK